MLSFVVMASPDGFSESELDAAAARALRWLPFEPAVAMRTTIGGGRVALLAWALHPDGRPPGGRIFQDDGWVTAYGGDVHPVGGRWDRGPWIAQLARWCRSGVVGVDRCPLWGAFSLVHLGPTGGFVRSDPLSIAPLFRAGANGCDVVANRPELVAAVCGLAGDRDELGVAWLLANEFYIDATTSFRGVSSLDAGIAIDVDAGGSLRTRHVDAEVWSPQPTMAYEDLLAAVADATAARCATIAALGQQVRLSLSGGRDSRLVLAFATAAGAAEAMSAVTYESFPGATDPDVEVATMVAQEVGLDHKVLRFQQAATTTAQLEERIARHVFTTAAMSGAKAPRPALRLVPFLQIGGGLGEMLSGQRSGAEVATVEQAQTFLAARLGAGLLAPDVRHELVTRQDRLVAELADTGVTPIDLPYEFFLRRIVHNGMGAELYPSSITPPMEPLYDAAIPALARAAGWRRRRYLRVHFDLMRAAAPRLAELPFADYGWPAEMLTDVVDPGRYTAPPIVGPDLPRGLRGLRWADHASLFADHLLDRSNPVAALLDRAAVDDVLAGRRPLDGSGVRQLFNALGIAFWLGCKERPSRTTVADVAAMTG